jgi:erythromycin esterase
MNNIILILLLLLGLIGCTKTSVETEPSTSTPVSIKEMNPGNDKDSIQLKKEWAVLNGIEISYDTGEFPFLKDILKDKRVVFIGENVHGASEFQELKTSLIKYLHQEMNFEVIAFESGMAETTSAYSSDLTPIDTMRKSLYPVWHTNEILELFTYIEHQKELEQPLIFTGIDNQKTTNYYGSFMYEQLNFFDENMANKALNADKRYNNFLISYYQKNILDEKSKNTLIENYTSIINAIKKNEGALKELHVKLHIKILEGRIEYIKTFKKPTYSTMLEQGKLRDQQMARNLQWLIEEMYPDKKIIVWAHNGHIRKQNSKLEQSISTYVKGQSFVELLPESLIRESYSLGIYMGSGKAVSGNMEEYSINPKESGSLEWTLSHGNGDITFYDILNRERSIADSWLFEPITSYHLGTIWEKFSIINQFDGLIYVDKVTPPSYID